MISLLKPSYMHSRTSSRRCGKQCNGWVSYISFAQITKHLFITRTRSSKKSLLSSLLYTDPQQYAAWKALWTKLCFLGFSVKKGYVRDTPHTTHAGPTATPAAPKACSPARLINPRVKIFPVNKRHGGTVVMFRSVSWGFCLQSREGNVKRSKRMILLLFYCCCCYFVMWACCLKGRKEHTHLDIPIRLEDKEMAGIARNYTIREISYVVTEDS